MVLVTNKEAVLVLSIDRDYLYKNDNPKNKKAYDMAIELLEDPDVVKVVRCKDCDRAKETSLGYICTNISASVTSDGNGYCHNGRRR